MNLPEHTQNFPIVGIGASAGGLNAFQSLLQAIPENSGMAYVLIQHLAAAHESMLPEILARSSKIPVHEITDDINITPNIIYIIPENKIVTASDGVLKLSPRDAAKPNLPIDIFFTSLAEVHRTFAIGVVLSGTGFDGTEGLKAIKENGGVTFAQDIDSAAFAGMPLSAIKGEVVDFILAPERIPEQLLKIKRSYEVNYADLEHADIPKQDDDIYKRIITLLRARTGNDFSNYKQATIRRRIARRMVATDTQELTQYLTILRHSKPEQDALFNDVLIPVTYFFRDPQMFDELSNEVFPHIVRSKKATEPIRIWVAGCATGEEAYSLAISLHEYLESSSLQLKIQVFASDISEHVVSKARSGLFSRQDVKNISNRRLGKYFIKAGNEYQVGSIIREMCIFAVHNFLKDPPFAKMDLISCRNVLIYMDVLLQKKALTTFHYALNPGGVLWLGKSESIGTTPDLFSVFNKQHKVYARKDGQGSFMRVTLARPEEEIFSVRNNFVVKQEVRNEFLKAAENILFTKFTPPAVIINDQMDIVHFHGDLSLILLPPQGKPSLNVLKMARHELVFELRNIFHKTKKIKGNLTSEKIPVTINDEFYLISFEIRLLPGLDEEYHLLIFNTVKITQEYVVEKTKSPKLVKENKAQGRIKQLETELNQLRDDIRSVTEDQEIFNEELQSANEELLSSSEELQSVNEELETSKEELQATNEELLSLNQELLDRQDQLFAVRNYAEAIVSSINTPLIILDKKFYIRNANQTFYSFFNTSENSTEGKSLFDINPDWNNPELKATIAKIIPEKAELKGFELTLNIPYVGERTVILSGRQLIYEKSHELLILIVVQDVTETRIAATLRESEERFRLATELTGLGTWELNVATDRIINSPKIREIMALDAQECSTEEFLQSVHPEDIVKAREGFEQALSGANLFLEMRIVGKDQKQHWIRVNGKLIPETPLKASRLLGTVMDITEQKTQYIQLEESEQRFKAIADSAPVLLWLADANRVAYFFNKGWLDFTGRPMDKEINNGWMEGVHPDDLNSTLQVYEQAFNDRQEFFLEYRLRRHDGEYRWMSIHGAPRYAPDGSFQGYVGGGIDITDQKSFANTLEHVVQERTDELKKSHESLQDRNIQLERSNNELASFSYVASHDLQEPLRRIQAFSDRILENEKNNLSETGKDYFLRMNRAAKQMKQLIHDLLEYSQVNSPNQENQKTDLNQVLDTVIASLNNLLDEKKAVIESNGLPTIKAVPIHFTQLFTNLITNSVKYSIPNVPPHIYIHCVEGTAEEFNLQHGHKDAKYWKITVKDNGIGFEPKYGEQIFDMFQRLHAKTAYEGTGIGLAICKKIVHHYDGLIQATGEPNAGATFTIYLPMEN